MKLQNLSAKKLFIAACILKVLCVFGSVALGEIWITGVALPLAVMLGYIFLGIYYRDRSVSDEKFADSCYYLGFLFTMVSIVASLTQLANVDSLLAEIGTRFGVAMVSTVFGMAARISLVTFRPNMEDALSNTEDQVVDSARRLADEFVTAHSTLRHLRSEVHEATRESVAQIKETYTQLTEQYAGQMAAYFVQVSQRQNQAFLVITKDVRESSKSLDSTIQEFSQGTEKTMERLDASLLRFHMKLMTRLDQLVFPDNLFADKLATPLERLQGSTDAADAGVRAVSRSAQSAAKSVERAVERINLQSQALSPALEVAQTILAEQTRVHETLDSVRALAERQLAKHQEATEQLQAHQQVVEQRLEDELERMASIAGRADEMGAVAKALMQHSEAQGALLARMADSAHKAQREQDQVLRALVERLEPFGQALREGHVERQQAQEAAAQVAQGQIRLLTELLKQVESGNQVHQRVLSTLAEQSDAQRKWITSQLSRQAQASLTIARPVSPDTEGSTMRAEAQAASPVTGTVS